MLGDHDTKTNHLAYPNCSLHYLVVRKQSEPWSERYCLMSHVRTVALKNGGVKFRLFRSGDFWQLHLTGIAFAAIFFFVVNYQYH